MKNRKEKEYDAPICVWTIIFSFLGVSALISVIITAIAMALSL